MRTLEREDECCGYGGTFAIKKQHISAAMVKEKVNDISKTGANLLLGGDCGCLLNISGAMKYSRNKTAHQQIAEFIAKTALIKSSSNDRDKTSLRFRFLSDSEIRSPILDFISRILAFPKFNKEILEREKNNSRMTCDFF